MDQSFFLKAKRLLEQRPPLDHDRLCAEISERQNATPTAAAAASWSQPDRAAEDPRAICAVILAEESWRSAVQEGGGCFSRAVARRRVNRP